MQSALAEGGWDVILSDYSLPEFDANYRPFGAEGVGRRYPFHHHLGKIGEETAVAALPCWSARFSGQGQLRTAHPAIERSLAERAVRAARRDAEQALRESEMRFRRLAESGLVGIVVADGSGSVSEANDAFLETVGYSREDLRADAFLGRP